MRIALFETAKREKHMPFTSSALEQTFAQALGRCHLHRAHEHWNERTVRKLEHERAVLAIEGKRQLVIGGALER